MMYKFEHYKLLIIPVLLFTLFGCASTARKTDEPAGMPEKISSMVVHKASNHSIERIAVLEFDSIEGETSLEGKLLSERIISRVVNDGSICVIERNKINEVIEEQKLQASGIIDTSTAKNIGKILGVDAVVIGTITNLGDINEINAKLLNVQTGEIIGAVTGQVSLEVQNGTSPETSAKLKNKRAELARQKKDNPKAYRKKVASNRKLAKLRKTNPQLFRKLVTTKKKLFKLAKDNPRRFVKMLGPTPIIPIGANMMKSTEAIKLMRTYFPAQYERLFKLRKKIIAAEKKKQAPDGRGILRQIPPSKYKRGH